MYIYIHKYIACGHLLCICNYFAHTTTNQCNPHKNNKLLMWRERLEATPEVVFVYKYGGPYPVTLSHGSF